MSSRFRSCAALLVGTCLMGATLPSLAFAQSVISGSPDEETQVIQNLGQITPELAALEARPVPSAPASTKVPVLGDSLADGLWMGMQQAYGHQTKKLTFERDGKISSGLAHPGFYDWPTKAETIANSHVAGALIMIGLNDQITIETDGARIPFGRPGWDAAYGKQVRRMVKSFTDKGLPVAWVGLPPVRDAKVNAGVEHINSIFAKEVPAAGGQFISTWDAFAGPDHGYAAYINDDHAHPFLARAEDGMHFSPQGYIRLGHIVEHALATNPKSAAINPA